MSRNPLDNQPFPQRWPFHFTPPDKSLRLLSIKMEWSPSGMLAALRRLIPLDLSVRDVLHAMPGYAKAYYICVVGAAGAIGVSAFWSWSCTNVMLYLSLFVGALVAGALKVQLPGIQGTMSVTYLFIMLALVKVSLAETLLLACSATFVQTLWHAKTRPNALRLTFNLGVISMSVGMAYAVFVAFLGSVNFMTRVAVTCCAYFVINTVSVSAMVALTERRNVGKVWRECYLWYFPYYLLGASIACAMEYLQLFERPHVMLLILPVIFVVYLSFRLYAGRLKDAEDMSRLHLQTIEALETSRRQAEESQQKAEETSRLKSEFLANVSHEIRTPMNGILGLTDLVMDTELTKEQRGLLKDVKTSAHGLLEIINDLLDFSKIESGRIAIQPVAFDLPECLAEGIRPLAHLAHKKKLELICDIGQDIPRNIVADPVRLRQVLINLIANAIKFTAEGEIVVRAAVRDRAAGGRELHFSIADTGIGISPEFQERMFDAFTQEDGSATRLYGGTGLGLAISKRLVSLMGGEIWLESERGKGSTFHFTAAFSQAAQPEPHVWVHPRLLQGAVLVVDDNPRSRNALAQYLASLQLRAVVAEGASDAIEKLKQEHGSVALALIDSAMPEVDGYALVQEMRQQASWRNIPVVLMTTGDLQRDALLGADLGRLTCLIKPVLPDDLRDALAGVLADAPVAESAPLSIVAARPQRTGNGGHILLAEDNPVNQKVLKMLLSKHGHSVTVVENGRLAADEVERNRFDLVLMDIQMPELDGIAATRRIREREAGTSSHVPIIALTAHAMKEDRERCLQAGMDDYLSKPIQPAELLPKIDKWKNTRSATLLADPEAASTRGSYCLAG